MEAYGRRKSVETTQKEYRCIAWAHTDANRNDKAQLD